MVKIKILISKYTHESAPSPPSDVTVLEPSRNADPTTAQIWLRPETSPSTACFSRRSPRRGECGGSFFKSFLRIDVHFGMMCFRLDFPPSMAAKHSIHRGGRHLVPDLLLKSLQKRWDGKNSAGFGLFAPWREKFAFLFHGKYLPPSAAPLLLDPCARILIANFMLKPGYSCRAYSENGCSLGNCCASHGGHKCGESLHRLSGHLACSENFLCHANSLRSESGTPRHFCSPFNMNWRTIHLYHLECKLV